MNDDTHPAACTKTRVVVCASPTIVHSAPFSKLGVLVRGCFVEWDGGSADATKDKEESNKGEEA